MVFKKGHKGYWKGRKRSENTKRKVGDFFRGKKYEEIMGEEKTKIKKAQLRKKMEGKNNPAWIDGRKLEYDYSKFNQKFKKAIRKRDNQICMNCLMHREKLNKSLDVHHIDYNEKNTIPQNCISLCRRCHGLTHFNRKHWKLFFQNLLTEKYNYSYSSEQEIILNLGAGKNV